MLSRRLWSTELPGLASCPISIVRWKMPMRKLPTLAEPGMLVTAIGFDAEDQAVVPRHRWPGLEMFLGSETRSRSIFWDRRDSIWPNA